MTATATSSRRRLGLAGLALVAAAATAIYPYLIFYALVGLTETLFIALIVADMQHPVTPILEAALVGEGLHDTRRMIARLRDIHRRAVVIDENLLRIGTVEVHLGHVQSPGSDESSAPRMSSIGRRNGWQWWRRKDLEPHPGCYQE